MADDQPDSRRYAQAKAILQHALGLPAAERQGYVDEACGDDAAMHADILSLLAAHDEATSRFLAGPAIPAGEDIDEDRDEIDLTGLRVGAYRLERLLGRGGMGTVYLASRDDGEFTKHVAIKFIRPSIVTPSLLRRFRAERQILADFDHPNIARLIDGGTTDGMPFFIMDYVPGETLAQILHRGPLPPAQAVPLALAIAGVLEVVHAKGLVFRDLKPSNIMLTPESHVKLLDFGIAKIMRGAADETATGLTGPGWIVGSPRYMSPEQAIGKPVDARSDVFSFGAVLFEALSGHMPFKGDTRSDYAENLIAGRVEPLRAPVSPRLRAVIERCLRKSPAERFESGRELNAAVRAMASDRRAGRATWATIAALALLVIVVSVWAFTRPKPDPETPLLKGPTQLIATWAGEKSNPRVSPDKKWISFISDRDGGDRILLLDRVSGDERSIVPPGGDVWGHEWSPSGDSLAYLATVGSRRSLTIAPIGDGKPRVFELRHSDAQLVRWIGNGIYYVSPVEGTLFRFDLTTERAADVTTKRGELKIRGADVSANERHIVFTASKDGMNSLWYGAIDGGGAVRLTEERIDPKYPRWKNADARDVVYVSEEGGVIDVWQLDVTNKRRLPVTATDAREGGIDVSGDGSLFVYEQISEDSHVATLNPADPKPVVRRMTADSLGDLFPSASSSGRAVVFHRSTTIDMSLGLRRATVQLSRDFFSTRVEKLAEGHAPEISPDGRWVAYQKWTAGSVAELWLTNVDANSPVKASDALLKFQYSVFPLARATTTLAWSPKEARLFFVRGPLGNAEVMSVRLPAAAGQPLVVEPLTKIADPTASVTDVQVSSDGSRLSYLLKSDSPARVELHVVDLARTKYDVRFSWPAGFGLASPGWISPDEVVVLRKGAAVIDVLIAREGAATTIARGLRNVDVGSPALDRRQRILYFIRTSGTGETLYALSLDTGIEHSVYQSQPHDPTIGGIRVLADGRLLFSYQSKNQDIYSNVFAK